MIEIIGYPGYFLADDGKSIIGKWGRALKPVNGCVTLQQRGKKACMPVNKAIWCANKGVSPDEVPRGYSFRWVNGRMMAETFSDRMSYARRKASPRVRISDEQIDYLKKYLGILEDIHNGVDGAKAELFTIINNDKEDYVAYACKLQNNNRDNAEIVVDSAIMATMEAICDNDMMVANPRGCVRSFIRGLVRENRRIIPNSNQVENCKDTKNNTDYGY